MWRNVSWNSTEPTSLPEGMHKHETGAYFKTPSIQSATSSQSGGGAVSGTMISAGAATNHSNSTESIGGGGGGQMVGGRSITPTDEIAEEPSMNESEPAIMSTTASKGAHTTAGPNKPVVVEQQQTNTRKMRRFKESGRQSSAAGKSSNFNNPNSSKQQANNEASSSSSSHHPGFRSRLSSISGALQHPKLAKRLFSHHQDSISESQQHHQAPVQITTTSIDSPQHNQSSNNAGHHQVEFDNQSGGGSGSGTRWAEQLEPRLMSSSSGRRLSQLFLPQLTNNPILNQDPYASNELIPPHLLGLYGQPPLVGGSVSPASAALGAQRASWADISLFGRLSNVRPSIDSAFHGGQVRHSFDARK